MLGYFSCFCCLLLTSFKINFIENSFKNTYRADPYQTGSSPGSALYARTKSKYNIFGNYNFWPLIIYNGPSIEKSVGLKKVNYMWFVVNVNPRGMVLWYFHIYVGSGHNWGFICLIFRKMNSFLYDEIWIFSGGQHKTGLFMEVFSIHFRAFSRYRVGIFWGVAKFQIFLGYAWYSW